MVEVCCFETRALLSSCINKSNRKVAGSVVWPRLLPCEKDLHTHTYSTVHRTNSVQGAAAPHPCA